MVDKSRSTTALHRIPIKYCIQPSGLADDRRQRSLDVVCHDTEIPYSTVPFVIGFNAYFASG